MTAEMTKLLTTSDPKTGMGPLIREAQRARVERYVESGTAEGARIHAGTVTINGGGGGPHLWGPFGGYKHSGIGREYGDYGLLEYTQLKTVAWSAGRP